MNKYKNKTSPSGEPLEPELPTKPPKSTDFTVFGVPILDSNYVWVLQRNNTPRTIVFDPGHAQPIIDFLEQKNLQVEAVFITHSHHDHIGGLDELLTKYPVPVYGPECQRIPQVTDFVKDNDEISIDGFGCFSIIHVPGHLPEHVAYLQHTLIESDDAPAEATSARTPLPTRVFSGDILFSSGCGRIFDGSAVELHQSLARLSQLPSHVLVYASHEYTVQNIKFALTIEPDNAELKSKFKSSLASQEKGDSTLPTRIGIEKQTNPFLRCSQISVKKSVENHTNKKLLTESEVFAELRKMKDVF